MTIAPAKTVALPEKGERIELPNGSRLFFEYESHAYYRCNPNGQRGRRLTGVTTACRALDGDPSRLLAWAARTQLIGVAELTARNYDLRCLTTQEEIQEALEREHLTFEDVRNTAAARGTTIHVEVFEALAEGRDPLAVIDPDGLTMDARMALKGALRFWEDEQPEPVLVEQVVYSERLGVAGRFDFYGRIKSREGVGLLDWKTGRFLGAAAHAQVGGGYPLLIEESGWERPAWAAMVRIFDGGYEIVDAEGTVAHFEAAVAAYRASGAIDNAARKARKVREAA